jgi:hypothetical protein
MGRPSTIFPGTIINNWIFVKQTDRIDSCGYKAYWIAICPVCKIEKEMHKSSIRHGKSKSCGCIRGCIGNKRISIAGQKFGKLIALYPTNTRKFGKICWMFRCECGTIKEIESSHVVSGATKTCGCGHFGLINDITGQTFNYLTAIKLSHIKERFAYWVFKCHYCGNEKTIMAAPVVSGSTKSCGCFRTIGRRGKLHHNYNHNKTNLERELDRGIPGVETWRTQVYKRDNFTCQICFKKSQGDLNAHHINCWAKYPNERLNIDNGITLCVKCHTNFHILYGRGNTNKEQWNEYVASYCLQPR